MPLRNLVWLLVIPGLVGLGLAVGTACPPRTRTTSSSTASRRAGGVDRSYVRELNDKEREELVKRMINGGLRWLDPNSVYLDEEDLKKFERENAAASRDRHPARRGRGQGDEEAAAQNLHVIAGSPAYDAGFVVGDEVIKVGDELTEKMVTWTCCRESRARRRRR